MINALEKQQLSYTSKNNAMLMGYFSEKKMSIRTILLNLNIEPTYLLIVRLVIVLSATSSVTATLHPHILPILSVDWLAWHLASGLPVDIGQDRGLVRTTNTSLGGDFVAGLAKEMLRISGDLPSCDH